MTPEEEKQVEELKEDNHALEELIREYEAELNRGEKPNDLIMALKN